MNDGPGSPELPVDDERTRASSQPEPPPLSDIRVRGPGARGLNKPAIMIAAGGSMAVILVLTSNGLSSDPSKAPADAKPLMSAPARPEVAQGAVRNLPANYEQAARQQAAREPAQPPELGPPLAGDVAAFAPVQPAGDEHEADGWSDPGYTASEPVDPALVESRQADRSELFFPVREGGKTTGSPAVHLQPPPPRGRPTAPGPQPVDPRQTTLANDGGLFPGAVIPASLVTEISSESPGPVIAQITQSIYDSATGRKLLIPQGARLIGDYKSSTRYGQSRIAIMWSRIIMSDGQEIALDEAAHDPSGTAGVTGKVDNHWLDVFGAAALGTLINIGVASTEDPQLSYGGIGAITRDAAEAAIADGAQRTASIVTNRVVDRSLAIPPTIKVEAGKRISVIVTRRLGMRVSRSLEPIELGLD